MVFADSVQVQSLTGKTRINNPANGNDITSTVISDAISRSDAKVILLTGVATWDTADVLYPTVKEASELFAACYILRRYADSDGDNKQANNYCQTATELCMSIASKSTHAIIVASRAYASYPINRETGTIHRSLVGGDLILNDDSLSGD